MDVAGSVAVVARWAILGIGAVSAWMVHEVVIADGDVSRVKYVLDVVAAGVVVVVDCAWFGTAGVDGDAGAAEVDGIGVVAH